jgi:hypothetical protein
MSRYLRLAGGLTGALALAFAIWFGGTVVHAANCAGPLTPGRASHAHQSPVAHDVSPLR